MLQFDVHDVRNRQFHEKGRYCTLCVALVRKSIRIITEGEVNLERCLKFIGGFDDYFLV